MFNSSEAVFLYRLVLSGQRFFTDWKKMLRGFRWSVDARGLGPAPKKGLFRRAGEKETGILKEREAAGDSPIPGKWTSAGAE